MVDEWYWTYKAASPTPTLQQAIRLGVIKENTTDEEWCKLTPGMRREICRIKNKST